MIMKKENLIGAIGVVGVVVLAAIYIMQYNAGQSPISETSPKDALQTVSLVNTPAPTMLTLVEIARHDTPSDCYMIVSGKVYSLGSYAASHPGGAQAITSFCGKDGTVAFETRGGKGNHPPSAQTILAQYYIGDVGGQFTAPKIPPTNSTGGATKINDENEYEDD